MPEKYCSACDDGTVMVRSNTLSMVCVECGLEDFTDMFENQRVGVVFSDGTKKKLIVKFANLKKI